MSDCLSVHAGTQFSVGVVIYNERSHYRRLLVRNITVDSYVHSSFDFTDFQSSDLFLTGECTCSIQVDIAPDLTLSFFDRMISLTLNMTVIQQVRICTIDQEL